MVLLRGFSSFQAKQDSREKNSLSYPTLLFPTFLWKTAPSVWLCGSATVNHSSFCGEGCGHGNMAANP